MSYIKLGNSKSVDPHQLLNSPTFKKINNSNLGQHFEDAIWTKVKLTNSSNQPIKVFLLNTIPLTQTLDLFVFENGVLIQHTATGAVSQGVQENTWNRFNACELSLQPKKEYTLLTKIYNPKGRIDTEWIVMSDDAYHHFLFQDSLIWGMIFGIFFLLFIFFLLLYFMHKNKFFLSYIAYMTVFWVYLFVNNGFSTYFFKDGALDLVLSHVSGYSVVIFYLLFLDGYLELTQHKKYPVVLKFLYAYGLYLALTSWVIIYTPVVYSFDNFYFLLTLVTLFAILFITTNEYVKRKNISIFYIFGQLSLIVSYLLLLLSSFQLIPMEVSYQQFLGIFSSIEMIFFTVAIFITIKHTIESAKQNEKLMLSQSHYATIGQTLKNIAHQWKVPMVRLGTLITELEAIFYKEKLSSPRIDEIVEHMRNSTEFMQNTITEFSNFYATDNKKSDFYLIDEINDVKTLLIEKMTFLNFDIVCDDSLQSSHCWGNSKSFAHVCMIIIDNAIDIANERHITNPWIKISTMSDTNRLIVHFEDNCAGITQKPIESIFELDISSHQEKERGVGLSIAKMLVEQKMGGKITVKNTQNGALFSLILSC